jgi:hypothetical protein
MSFRNRYIIATANGLCQLSIPLLGGRDQKTMIQDIKINNSTNWRLAHWRTLLSAYNKAPYFEYYAEELKDLIFSEEEFLFSFNCKILDWVCKMLTVNVLIGLTEEFFISYPPGSDYRNRFLPKSFQQQAPVLHYQQVFQERIGFQPNLSILDLILCEGPNAIHLLTQNAD